MVGGGKVAARKCRALLSFGADVTVVAKEIKGHMTEAPDEKREEPSGTDSSAERPLPGRLELIERPFREEDVTGRDWTLVVAATDDRSVNSRIAGLCRMRKIPVNVADCREECSFFFPASCRAGSIAVGISTCGQSPALASALRKRLERALPKWLEEIGKESGEKIGKGIGEESGEAENG